MVNTGDTAWVLASASLVLLMTPGLALFYGGMVRAKSALNMMMMSFGALGLISVLWVLYGYSLAFGDDVGGGLLGSPTQYLGLGSLLEDTTTEAGGLPAMAFVGFQAVFAIITVALVSGAVAERMKFGGWLVFAGVWATVVYFPVAHWVFDFSAGDQSAAGSPTRSVPSTSPAAPLSTSTPARPHSRWRWCWAPAAGSAPRRCARTTCRS
ncbi:ammonium transporter [Nocardioides lacusdianchii]|uniref:ammonium transporter n=1 Tax=Nocardioides lacusdianchii TaxID=2783664 RepID=UPI0027DFBC1E|nr:hypothetical protein [Nocardioides lacusdianchii]